MNAQARVLQDLSQVLAKATQEETPEQELARLRAENAKLRDAKAQKWISCKVTEKGGVSVYGLGRFPVTLYAGQWDKLIAHIAEVKAFVDENRSQLSIKE